MARDATLIGCGLAPGVLQVSKFSLCGGIHQLRRGEPAKTPARCRRFCANVWLLLAVVEALAVTSTW